MVHGSQCHVLPSFYHAQLHQEVSSLDHRTVGLCRKGFLHHDSLGNYWVKKWPELRTRTLLSVALILLLMAGSVVLASGASLADSHL